MPLASVIIPTYNRASLVRDCIQSVLAQDHTEVEIIVIDDGSTDDTPAVLDAFGDKISRLHQTNSGQALARKRGIEAATGVYLALLDSDDLWHPNFLSDSIAAMEEHGCSIVWSNYSVATPTGDVLVANQFKKQRPYLPENPTDDWTVLSPPGGKQLMLKHYGLITSATLLRRDLIQTLPNAKQRIGDDMPFFTAYTIQNAELPVAYSHTIRWQQRVANDNIRQTGADAQGSAKHSRNDANAKLTVLDSLGDQLSTDERQLLETRLARDYFDWAYHEQLAGNHKEATRLYAESQRLAPNSKTRKALWKARLRSVIM